RLRRPGAKAHRGHLLREGGDPGPRRGPRHRRRPALLPAGAPAGVRRLPAQPNEIAVIPEAALPGSYAAAGKASYPGSRCTAVRAPGSRVARLASRKPFQGFRARLTPGMTN